MYRIVGNLQLYYPVLFFHFVIISICRHTGILAVIRFWFSNIDKFFAIYSRSVSILYNITSWIAPLFVCSSFFHTNRFIYPRFSSTKVSKTLQNWNWVKKRKNSCSKESDKNVFWTRKAQESRKSCPVDQNISNRRTSWHSTEASRFPWSTSNSCRSVIPLFVVRDREYDFHFFFFSFFFIIIENICILLASNLLFYTEIPLLLDTQYSACFPLS